MLDNGFTLNLSKCEVLAVSPSKPTMTSPLCTLDSQFLLIPRESAKCLGYWWSWDLSPTKSIDAAIGKARRSFFAYGSLGAFQGKLNPLTGRAIYETCVIPILLYGCKNWILSDANISSLESFQGELGRRILKLPKTHSLLATRLALQCQSIIPRILFRKLSLLSRVSLDGESIGSRIFTTLMSNSQCHLSFVRECQSLEDKIGCQGITQDVLYRAYTSMRSLSKFLAEVDWQKSLSNARNHQSTSVAAEIATFTSWLKLWDTALDYGPLGTASLQGLYRELIRPSFSSKHCHLCDINHLTFFN